MNHENSSAAIGLNQAALSRKKVFDIVRLLFAITFCVISIFPIYWMLVSSFKSQQEILLTIPTFWPREWHFENYVNVFQRANFARYYLNTTIMTIAVLFLKTVTGVLAAYGFSKGRFRGKNVLFMVVLGAMMVPIQVTFISLYIMCARWHIVDTFWALVLPEAVSSYFIFLLRQNFMAVDDSYVDAAKMDGMGRIGIITNVMIPMCKATVTTLFLVTVTGSWNSYFWPKIVMKDPAKQVLTVGLANIRHSFHASEVMNNHEIMAGAVMAVLPVVILFFIFQKYLLTGYSKASMK